MRTSRSKWLAWLTVFALVIAACGGDDAGDDGADTTQPTETTAAGGDTETTAAPDTTEDTEPAAEIATDFGVDNENMTITLGLLSDLTGNFGPLVSAITEGIRVYWEDVNANGGIEGYTVELEVVDTQYVIDNHVQLYDEMKDDVVAIQHSTGSPHTVAILDQLAEDDMLAIPLTWYSGWSDPAINANLIPHGSPYCLESMNGISYIANEVGAETIAIATVPGDYGLDGAAGAAIAAEALGLEVVFDGSGTVIPGDETTLSAAAEGIANSGADMVWLTLDPGSASTIFGLAIAEGFEADWGGNRPTWNPAFVGPDSPIRDAITRDFWVMNYGSPWFSEEASEIKALFEQYSDASPTAGDNYAEGFIEASIMERALRDAHANGDLTRAGVLAAAKAIDSLEFGPFAPEERYAGEPNDVVNRSNFIGRPDPEGLAAGTSTGWTLSAGPFTEEITANYQFDGACYVLGN